MIEKKIGSSQINHLERTTIKHLIEEIQIEEENIKKLNEEKDVFLETKEIIENSYEEMKNNVTPKFTQKLSNIASNISNGKYKKVIFDEEKGLVVELETGEYKSFNSIMDGVQWTDD